MRKIFIILFLLCFAGCASADVNDFQRAKQANELNQSNKRLLDSKYVGFTKEAFIQDFGKPRKVIKDSYPYSLNADCYASDCPEGTADELLTYTILEKDKNGKHYISVYAYIKDGMVVRIR